jgi:hypothetical protein
MRSDRELVEEVEEAVGSGSGAWDMVNPEELARAFRQALMQAVEAAALQSVHAYLGLCPDDLQPDSRDPECPACAVILEAEKPLVARPLADWHDDDGPVLWWRFPVDGPPWIGTPLDDEWPVLRERHGERAYAVVRAVDPGLPPYYTHWTPITVPAAPEEER